MQQKVFCDNCDSEYDLIHEIGCLSDEPKYCIVCKSTEISITDCEDCEEYED